MPQAGPDVPRCRVTDGRRRDKMDTMAQRTAHRTIAYAPFGAFAATSILLLLGLVGTFVTVGVIIATAGAGEGDPLSVVSQMATALFGAFGGFAFAGLGGLLLAGQSKADVGADGSFQVRSWPPWRVRRVDLTGLDHIASRRGPLRRKGLLAATRHSTTLSLRDRTGATVSWNPAFWRGAESVASALRDAAVASGATVDPGAADVLDDPPFGRT